MYRIALLQATETSVLPYTEFLSAWPKTKIIELYADKGVGKSVCQTELETVRGKTEGITFVTAVCGTPNKLCVQQGGGADVRTV